jgi:hypothetical protein
VEGKASHRWWLWVFASADTAVFVLDPWRSAAVPKAFFGTSDDQAARGLLGSDFYRVYQALGEGILSLFCWAHLRRHFLKAARGYPSLQPWAEGWRERIATLYQLHQARQALPPGDPAYLEADAKLGRFVQVMETDWRTQQDDPTLAPAGGDVLKTMERHWQGLTRFLEHPQLPLDNNEVERLLRTPVVGRKNFYGSGAQVERRGGCHGLKPSPPPCLKPSLTPCPTSGTFWKLALRPAVSPSLGRPWTASCPGA